MTVLEDEVTVVGAMTYGELAKTARTIAVGLIERDILPGDRVALMLPTGKEFFAAFFGILYAGAIPVPIYPPMQRAQIEEYARRQAGILRNAGARMLITVPEGLRLGSLLKGLVRTLSSIESAATLSPRFAETALPNLQNGSATALIQYTSGSTGDPKGVVLSHANLLANIRAIGRAVEATSADVFVSWLPLYHDMGLIGAWLGCLYYGAPLYAMSPLSFLARPQSWLWAIHRFHGTLSAAPNFAFELCLNKIDDSDLKGLDLELAPLRRKRRRAGEHRDFAPVHRTFCAVRISAGGHGTSLRPCRKCCGRHLAAARTPTGHRSGGSCGLNHARDGRARAAG